MQWGILARARSPTSSISDIYSAHEDDTHGNDHIPPSPSYTLPPDAFNHTDDFDDSPEFNFESSTMDITGPINLSAATDRQHDIIAENATDITYQKVDRQLVRAVWGDNFCPDRAVHQVDSDASESSSGDDDDDSATEDNEEDEDIYDVPLEEWNPNKYKETGRLTARDTIDLDFVRQSVRLGMYCAAAFVA